VPKTIFPAPPFTSLRSARSSSNIILPVLFFGFSPFACFTFDLKISITRYQRTVFTMPLPASAPADSLSVDLCGLQELTASCFRSGFQRKLRAEGQCLSNSLIFFAIGLSMKPRRRLDSLISRPYQPYSETIVLLRRACG
jgi:hypothetical protein